MTTENCDTENWEAEEKLDNPKDKPGKIFVAITALGDSGYIICSIYGSKEEVCLIKNCKHLGCKSESPDGIFTYCCYYKRCLSCKTQEIENIDEKSCNFGGGVPILIGSFESKDK